MLKRLPSRRSFQAVVLIALACVAVLLACLKLAPRRTATRSASVQELELELRELRERARGSHATRPSTLAQLKEQLRMLKTEDGATGAASKEELERRLKMLRRS